ncbi:MAG: hypothetical protein IJG84_04565 [Kiritimatiellae bacterium]|nr:hypothetical protein [Kiritimatiellia bacterium]
MKNRRTLKASFVVLVVCSSASPSVAADFPTGGSAAVVDFPGVYTASGDVTYPSFKIGSTAATGDYVFDLTNGLGAAYAVTLTGSGSNVMSFWSPNSATEVSSATLRGGTWNFTGADPKFNQDGSNGPWHCFTLDGTTVTGSGLTFYCAGRSGDHDSRTILTNGASLSVKNLYLTGYGGASRASLEVTDGSTITVGNAVGTDSGNTENAPLGLRIRVDGAGSSITTAGGTTIGSGQQDIGLEILNGATYDATGKGVSLANGRYSADCHLLVSNDASLVCAMLSVGSFNNVTSPQYPSTHGNTVCIADGATLTVDNLYFGCAYQTSGSSNNVFEVSNANFTCKSMMTLYGSNCTDNVMRFVGADSVVSISDNFKALVTRASAKIDNVNVDLGCGARNVLEIDGATWNSRNNFRIGDGVENEIRVVNGGKIDFDHFGQYTFTAGAKDSNNGPFVYHGDKLFVGDRAELSAFQVLLTGDGDRMVVSNGTVRATKTDTAWNNAGVILSYIAENYGYRGTNNVVTLQGDSPLIESAGAITLRSNLRIEFDIPSGGYREGHVPMQAPVFRFDLGKAVLVPNVEEFRESLTSKTSVTLVQATTTLNAGTVIADSNAVAPEGCEFSVGTDSRSIVLTVKPPKRGFMLLFR